VGFLKKQNVYRLSGKITKYDIFIKIWRIIPHEFCGQKGETMQLCKTSFSECIARCIALEEGLMQQSKYQRIVETENYYNTFPSRAASREAALEGLEP
jgi:hypothetical protein